LDNGTQTPMVVTVWGLNASHGVKRVDFDDSAFDRRIESSSSNKTVVGTRGQINLQKCLTWKNDDYSILFVSRRGI
jgi:hypothetical protein